MRCRSLLLLLPSAVVAVALASVAVSAELPPPGTVLSESSNDIGLGYREVAQSKVNGLGSFEGVGHFTYVYYRAELLCQCGRGEIAISPNGAHAIFVEGNGKLILFRSATGSRQTISEVFVGHPTRAEWEAEKAVVTLERYEHGKAEKGMLHVRL
jgi:hypothetical protein